MNEFLDKASSHITGKTISEADIDELERLSNEHPYFSVSHVLLAKKYKSDNHSAFIPQVQKAAVFFNNPHWLHYQLLSARPEFIATEDVQTFDESNQLPLTSDLVIEEKAPIEVNQDDKQPETVFSSNELVEADLPVSETLQTQSIVEPEETEITPDELHPEREEVLEDIQEDLDAENTIGEEQVQDKEVVEDDNTSSSSDNTLDDIHSAEQEQTEEPVAEKDLIETVVESTLVQPVSIDDSLGNTTNTEVKTRDESPTFETTTSAQHEAVIPQPVQTVANPTAANEPLIPIEPYYTVDYFASQGIKLTLDKNPQDKLGKQLRSFTDWLKHMKKLGPEDALKATTDTHVDPVIKVIADTSNAQEEVVTEAMADVLVKQGKSDQAIDVYNKLSFLNPDKSAYFADQIQKLKGT